MDTKAKILDIAMNLNRIGNWAADGFALKKNRIDTFLTQTSKYMSDIDKDSLSEPFKKTFLKFSTEYQRLEKSAKSNLLDELSWAEKMMTWGNILTHRAKFL